jgi:hypothetical protein
MGAAIAYRFDIGGASVTVTGRNQVDDLGPRTRMVQVNSSTLDGAANLADALNAEGPVDILVNAVGGSLSRGGCSI